MNVFQLFFSSRATSSFWRLFAVLITLAGMLLLSWVMFNPIRVMAKAPGAIPVAMHSAYAADYTVDSNNYLVPAISLDLIDEVIRDSAASSGNSEYDPPTGNLPASAVVIQNTATSDESESEEESKPKKTLPAATATPRPSPEPTSALIVVLPTSTPSEILLPEATPTSVGHLPVRPTQAGPVLQKPTKAPKTVSTPKPDKKVNPTNPVKIKKTKPARP